MCVGGWHVLKTVDDGMITAFLPSLGPGEREVEESSNEHGPSNRSSDEAGVVELAGQKGEALRLRAL